ncbi:hypothetical protein [Methanoplanus endosymbiosus]|nr:hypothetical protein [Methanoplanus endosymbiosus]
MNLTADKNEGGIMVFSADKITLTGAFIFISRIFAVIYGDVA